jgi:hypothetical protein
MNAQQKFDHWLKIAKEELVIANELFNSGHLIHMAFMCQ